MSEHPYTDDEVVDLKASGHWPADDAPEPADDDSSDSSSSDDGQQGGPLTPAEPYPPAE